MWCFFHSLLFLKKLNTEINWQLLFALSPPKPPQNYLLRISYHKVTFQNKSKFLNHSVELMIH